MAISDRFWTSMSPDDVPPDPATLTMTARSMMVARRALQDTLPVDFLHDPALDILLALFVMAVEERSATAETIVAATTIHPGAAHRWIGALAQEGLVTAEADSVALTDDGLARVTTAIRAVIRSQVDLYGEG